MNDPLYAMEPRDKDWLRTLSEEAEDLSTALWQEDDERALRKAHELLDALPRWITHLGGVT